MIVVIANVCPSEVTIASPTLRARNLQLHPIQVHYFRSDDFLGVADQAISRKRLYYRGFGIIVLVSVNLLVS